MVRPRRPSARRSAAPPPGGGPARSAARRGALALGILLLGALPLLAQDGCICDPCGELNIQTLPGIGRVTYISAPQFSCDGGVRIIADSAVAYDARAYSELIGSVRYVEATRELFSDQARYFTNEGRLQAEGNLILRDAEQGSEIRDGDLVYLLETDFREEAEMTVTTGADGIRPRALLAPPEPDPDSVSPADSPADSPVEPPAGPVVPAPDTLPPTPYTVESDRMFLRGQGYFTAAGTVEIVRDSLFAYGDSAVYDQAGGGLELEGSARVEGEAYRLVGRRISMSEPGGAASRVHALRDARLDGDGFDLTSAQISVFLRDDALERLVATPIAWPGRGDEAADSADLERPEALVQDFVLTADSLEINAPAEVIERVFASGRARSVSSARDSLNVDVLPDVARSDWLEGDTVIVTFAPNPGATSASDVDVDAITAKVGARSLYRLPPNDSTAVPGQDAPALHYVTGDSIRIQMNRGEVVGMRVTGQTRGVHLEPLRRAAPADTAAVGDSLGALPDTSGVAVDTTGLTSLPARTRPHSNDPEHTRRPEDEPRPRTEEEPWIRP